MHKFPVSQTGGAVTGISVSSEAGGSLISTTHFIFKYPGIKKQAGVHSKRWEYIEMWFHCDFS